MRRFGFLAAVFAVLTTACSTPSPPPTEVPMPENAAVADETSEAVDLSPLVEIRGARRPLPGLLTGGQPTKEELAAVAAAGYRTVITLRPEEELAGRDERGEVEALGMNYRSLPIASGGDLQEANARMLAELLEGAESPILLHCGSGNRVGGLLALRAHFVDGASAEDALNLGQEAGLTRLEPVIRERLGLPAEQ